MYVENQHLLRWFKKKISRFYSQKKKKVFPVILHLKLQLESSGGLSGKAQIPSSACFKVFQVGETLWGLVTRLESVLWHNAFA